MLLFATAARADDVFFRDSSSLRGLVVEEHHDRVVVSTEEGEKTVLREEVDEIFYAEPERNQLYLGAQALEAGDFGGARQFFQRAFQMNPRLLEARDALNRMDDMERKAGQMPLSDPEAILRELGLELRVQEVSSTQAVSAPSAGIGHPVPHQVVVQAVQRGSVAQRWGLLPEDALVGYWGESLANLPPAEVARRLAGPEGSALKLTLQRQVGLPPGASHPPVWPGVKLDLEHFGLTAREVEPTGAAFVAGLRSGDRVIQLGGAPTRYMPLGAARKALQQAREKGIPLVIHRDLMITREGKKDV